MTETPYMAVLRVWAAMAWADDVIAPAEAEALRRLVAVAPIKDEERVQAYGYLETKVPLDVSFAQRMGNDGKRGLYQAAVRLARVDLEIASKEREMLDRLRDALGIDPQVAADVEAQVAS